MPQTTPLLPGLSPVAGKPLTATFDAGLMSSDGGVIVLREIALRLGLADVIATPLPDDRDPTRILHSYADMVTARMMAIAAGYEDCDDLDALRTDPAFKLACGRAPETGPDLMSQPTLSRLENLADRRTLKRIGLGFIDLFCTSWKRVPDRIVLDIDDTDDPAHGQQVLALFNAHVGATCFQPIMIFEATSGKPVLSLIRPGKRPSGKEIAYVLRHVIGPHPHALAQSEDRGARRQPLLRRARDRAAGRACAATTFWGSPSTIGWLRWPSRGKSSATANAPSAGRRCVASTSSSYAADSWSEERKVIARVEATDMGTDVRFIVTNLEGRGKVLYEKVYCARGRMENLIKDMKLYTRSDKTACSRWQANQFRLFLHMGAYWLLHSLRRAAPTRSIWRGATFDTIRRTFVKVAVRVEELRSRIKLSFPASYPHADVLIAITGGLAAEPP